MSKKILVTSTKRQDAYRKVFDSPDKSKVLEVIDFPHSYAGLRNLSNLIKLNDASHCGVTKIVSYEIIWCTGMDFFCELAVSSPEDLYCDDINADYARVIEFEGEKVLFVYSRS